MTDELYEAYDRELQIMGALAGEFARKHPKIASRLSLNADETGDPHVERLLQGFAFLAARIHKRLDDDFPEMTEALLGAIYPHYLRPIPSMMIVELGFDPAQAASTNPHRVDRGKVIETEPVEPVDEKCSYRTCFDVAVHPVRVADARFSGPPFRLPVVPPVGTASVLTVDIETLSHSVSVDQLSLFPLRLHLHDPLSGKTANLLYEMLLRRCLGIVVSGGDDGGPAGLLSATVITPAGFRDDEAAIPGDARSFAGYRMLTEFFTLPRKFLFLDVDGGNDVARRCKGPRLSLSFLLATTDRELERSVNRETVRLGCTPAVNLMEKALDPISIDGRAVAHCLPPDVRSPHAFEIHAIKEVRLIEPGATSHRLVLPMHAAGSAGLRVAPPGERGLWWTISRRRRTLPRPDGSDDHASDVWMSIVDEKGGPVACVDRTIHVITECVNRNLPGKLKIGEGRPRLSFHEDPGPLSAPRCLHKPTQTLRLDMGRGLAWRLISHLSLNHLSLCGGEHAAEALREILGLYLVEGMDDLQLRRRWVDGIKNVSSARMAARLPPDRGRDPRRSLRPSGGIAQGLEVKVTLDDDAFADGAGAYLFSTVLEQYLGLWVSINSFTRLVVTSRQRDSRGEEWRWPPRVGQRVLA